MVIKKIVEIGAIVGIALVGGRFFLSKMNNPDPEDKITEEADEHFESESVKHMIDCDDNKKDVIKTKGEIGEFWEKMKEGVDEDDEEVVESNEFGEIVKEVFGQVENDDDEIQAEIREFIRKLKEVVYDVDNDNYDFIEDV